MKLRYVWLSILAFLILTAPGFAQQNLNVNVTGYTLTTDVCQNPIVPKSSLAVNIATATTTQLVALSTGETISVCGFSASLMGTTPSIEFENGTGTTCGTGTTALTGTFAPTSGSFLHLGFGPVQFAAPVSNALCAVSGGTTPSIQGILVYVKR